MSFSKIKSCCLFCEDASGTLHAVSTFNLDARVRRCSLLLEDKVLVAKLSAGDLISQEAKHHSKCLLVLYSKAERPSYRTQTKSSNVIQGIALAQLVAYIEETRTQSVDTVLVFKLAELTEMYTTRLERIIRNVPGLQAYKKGRDVMLVFNKDEGQALKSVYEQDFDSEGMILLKASQIVRRDIINTKSEFVGTFENN